MKTGFYIDARIGDSVVGIPALYAIKLIFPQAKLFLFTNRTIQNLFQNLAWIDEIYIISSNLIADINSLQLDFLYSSNDDQKTIAHLKSSNAKKLVTYLRPYNFFDPKLKCVIKSYSIKHQSEKQNYLDLINRPNPFKKISLNDQRLKQAKLNASQKHKQKIQDFLTSSNPNNQPIIIINPFAFAARLNLSLSCYFYIAEQLADRYCVIMPTFGDKTQLVLDCLPSNLKTHQNFVLFINDNDLLNMVALVSTASLLISPSTGIIHIADNLEIPSVALFSKKDTIVWAGEYMHYIVLDHISEEEAMQQTLDILPKILAKLH